jgi:hypothetical protein
MDKAAIAKSAATLRQFLDKYAAVDPEAANLRYSLSSVLDAALLGTIDDPMEWSAVPGGYYFTEGDMRKYRELEDAYADFKIEVTGGETPVLRKLRMAAAMKP